MTPKRDRDELLVGLLDQALVAVEQGRPVDSRTWRPDLAAEGRQLLRVVQDFLAAAAEWQTLPPPAAEAAATGDFTPPGATPADATLPDRLGRYRILGRLGSGGMGDVYRAHDPHLDREVAVKLPRFDPHRPGAARQAERFLREARAAAAVRHPHVCPIHDAGEHAGRPFVVMALVPGESLADRLRRDGRFADPRQAVRLAASLAAGLAAVHDHGIVHRDLKPANVLLDRDGQPLLSDFGLARSLQEGERLTHDGAVLGTPAYMPPEQATGDDAGPAADVYSLGVVLYEMLTGQLPFPCGSVSTVLYHVVHTPPTPPTDFRPDLDPALVGVLDRALAKDPADRFPDGRACAAALGQWLGDPPPGDPAPVPRRRRGAVLAAGLALAGLLTATLAAGLARRPYPEPRSPNDPDAPVAAALPPLDADLVVGISTPGDGPAPAALKRDLGVNQDGALPVRTGELTRVRVRLSQPAHCYLLWIDSRGEVQPAYPWDIAHSRDGWRAPWVPGGGDARTSFAVPAEAAEGLEIAGPPGLETVVLLARRTPLPADVDLAALTDHLPPSPFHDPSEVAWLNLRGGEAAVQEVYARHRGLVAGRTRPVDRSLFALLEDRLRPHFELLRAVRFAHADPLPLDHPTPNPEDGP